LRFYGRRLAGSVYPETGLVSTLLEILHEWAYDTIEDLISGDVSTLLEILPV
jgi:hypothetical protein